MSNITVKAGTPIVPPMHSSANSEKKGSDALVLSAGGWFAAYQAGVYKALWPYWKPDLVVGASAGALNAWLIASRVDPDELIDQWLHPDAAKAVKFRDRPNLWSGYFDPGPLLSRARDIQRDFERRLPLGVVSIEVPRFRPRIFRDEEITPEHLVATCSIPLFYPTVRIDGRRLLDGGLFEATPVWAAAAMGATRVIAINSLPRLTPWPIHMVLSAMHSRRKMPVPESLDVSTIVPSGRMGSARDAVVWERGNIRRWVDMGLRDGEEFLTSWAGLSGPPT
jgi:predicted acylesterase/phospholipase RssA